MTIVQFPGGEGDPPLQDDPAPQPEKKKYVRRGREQLVAFRRDLWEDRIQGKTYEQIAQERGVPVRTVIYNCQASVREMDVTGYLDEEMALSLGQLNRIQATMWSGLMSQDTEAADIWFKAYDRKMKLLGLEAPKRIDVHAEIIAWAEREGLDPVDVIDVTASLLPVPKPPSYST